jgi:hypothetical protein
MRIMAIDRIALKGLRVLIRFSILLFELGLNFVDNTNLEIGSAFDTV